MTTQFIDTPYFPLNASLGLDNNRDNELPNVILM